MGRGPGDDAARGRDVLAQARVWARQEGVQINEEAGAGSRHWIRGVVDIEGSEICVDVNSEARLDAILGILGRLGARDFVVDRRSDPSLDRSAKTGTSHSRRPASYGALTRSHRASRLRLL